MAHEGQIEKLDGFKSDFRCLETGQGIEIKTDYWAMSNTVNFFMEHYSDKNKQTPGGPYQALANGSNIFVYFYIKDMTFFKFETPKLVDALNDIIKTIPPTDVKNSTYVTQGYRVPRHLLKDIYTIHKLKVSVEDGND
jgi:hypothetical protein